MQNRNRVLTVEGLLALMVFAVAPATSARAIELQPAVLIQQDVQPPQQPKPDATQPTPMASDQSQATQKSVVVTGTIIKSGSDFVLKDAQGTVYRLDAQDKAAPFENKSVKVTGKLDQAVSQSSQPALIHIDAIEAAQA